MRRRTLIPILSVAVAGLLAQGCATIISGPNQKVPVFTEPPGATVTVGSQQIVSPGVLKLPRGARETEVTIALDGYQTRTIVLARKTNGLVWLDLLGIPAGLLAGSAASSQGNNVVGTPEGVALGGVLMPATGFGIDYTTGAAFKLDPPKIVVTLVKVAVASAAATVPFDSPE